MRSRKYDCCFVFCVDFCNSLAAKPRSMHLFLTNASTAAFFSDKAARCSAVEPSTSTACMLAPFSTSLRTLSAWPVKAATAQICQEDQENGRGKITGVAEKTAEEMHRYGDWTVSFVWTPGKLRRENWDPNSQCSGVADQRLEHEILAPKLTRVSIALLCPFIAAYYANKLRHVGSNRQTIQYSIIIVSLRVYVHVYTYIDEATIHNLYNLCIHICIKSACFLDTEIAGLQGHELVLSVKAAKLVRDASFHNRIQKSFAAFLTCKGEASSNFGFPELTDSPVLTNSMIASQFPTLAARHNLRRRYRDWAQVSACIVRTCAYVCVYMWICMMSACT
jgi:hypothetical protein